MFCGSRHRSIVDPMAWSWRNFERWRLGSIVLGFCGAGAYLFQIVVGLDISTWLRWFLSGVGSVLLAISVAVPLVQESRTDRERKAALRLANEATATYDRQMHKILIPVSSLLAEIISAPTARAREIQQAQMKQAVVGYALDNIVGTEPRSSFYEYRPGHPRKLVCSTLWKGRIRAPRPVFEENTPAGNAALHVLDDRITKFVPDVRTTPPPGWPADRDYETYIQAPVYNGDMSFGLLCVDAPKAGELQARDIRLLELLAQMLGSALAVH